MSSKPRLLLIDENADDRALSRLVLSSQFPGALFDEVGDADEFLEALELGYYDLVISELETSWGQGVFLLRAIRAAQQRAPIVLFTAVEDRASAVEALKAGAVDFIVKSSAGFLDLRRAATEALPEAAAELDAATHRPDPAERRSEPLVEEDVEHDRTRLEADVEAPPLAADPLGFLADPPRVAIDPLGLAVEPQDRASEPEDRAAEPEPERRPRPDPEARASVTPGEAGKVEVQPATVESLPAAAGSRPAEASAAEPIREAVESARQSIVAMGHRPLGAVLGIIAILAAFIILYATFFGGESDAVEAGATPSMTRSGQTLEPAARPAAVEREAGTDAATPPEVQPESVARPPDTSPAPSSESSPASPPAVATAPLLLELRAEAEVWIQVTVDNEQVLDAVLAPGQVRNFSGQKMATLLIGNAAGLSVRWNGEDLGSLGREGQVRRLHFSPTEVGVGTPPR